MTEAEIKSKLDPTLPGPRILPDADYNVLRPCPFCGNYPSQKIGKNGYGFAVRCETCKLYGPWGHTKHLAQLAWNTRGGK